ncbi:dnaJ homolog subfamily C member 13-like [Tetranychus urticae]|nr:dnaJ homolog subfamily C member 13-like [Tetranychus urticae]
MIHSPSGNMDSRELSSFLVTKHSWRGNYKRILTIGTQGITTYNPNSMEATNVWSFCDIINVSPINEKLQYQDATLNIGGNEMFNLIIITKKRKTDTMKFSSEYRSDIICSALAHRAKFSEMTPRIAIHRYDCFKYSWSEKLIPVTIEIDLHGINQINPTTGRLLTSYFYRDIDDLILLNQNIDNNPAFAISTGGFSRLHLFTCTPGSRDDLLKKICEVSWLHTGSLIRIKKDPISLDHFLLNRFGKHSTDDAITSLYEFTVHKVTARNARDPVRRILALTDSCLIERDPNSYSIVTLKPLHEIFALVRNPTNPQLFLVEFIRGQVAGYTSTDRDALLASLLDGVRASGNIDIHVKMTPTCRGHRIGPYSVPVDEETESRHLKFLHTLPNGWTFNDAVIRFNSNCSYSGLLHSVTQDGLFSENKEKLIQLALGAFVEKEAEQREVNHENLEQHFQALRRLVASKAGFAAFTLSPRFREYLGVKVVNALDRKNDAVTHAAIDILCALMQPMHDDYDLRQEQLNKSSLLSSKKFLEDILNVLKYHVNCGTGALVVASMLDFLTFALCAPYSETTDGGHFDTLLTMVASYGRPLFKLFQHPSLAIVKGAGLVMKAIIEEGDAKIAHQMQELALAEGSLPRHLHIALFPPSNDSRYLAFQQLSRHLVALWIVDNETAMALLRRIFPLGLLNYLESTSKPPKSALSKLNERNNLKMAQDSALKSRTALDQIRDIHPSVRVIERQVETALKHWRERIGIPKRTDNRPQIKPILLRKRRERIKSTANWPMFYYQFENDHAKPDLIWNYKTREELRESLENENRAFNQNKELISNTIAISWNHREYEVPYHSLGDEIRINDYYLRLLLEEGERGQSLMLSDKLLIKKPYEFFNDLYHRFLLPTKASMKICCLQAMSIVYDAYHADIGTFNDVKWIIAMLKNSVDRVERDRLLIFISKLVLNQENVKHLIDAGGIKVLVDLLTLAHLHVSRAIVNAQTNLIEGTADQMSSHESWQEWYYMEDKDKKGPFSFKEMKEMAASNLINESTKCYASGVDGWNRLGDIPQLKWYLLYKTPGIMNETELATLILEIFIHICEYYPSRDSDGAIIRPLPRIKRFLSEDNCLRHIVQLLLTFDSVLVARVATLLTHVMQDNPSMSRLYQTGLFYFILMYTGSNLLPIGRLLHISHSNQAFRSDDPGRKSNIVQRSILGSLLPEAMICYLENYGPERFAQIFLGEFDTPEAIWNGEMRRLMIEKIATHIADFTPRLRSNTRALYQYCPIPPIQYPQLENELFCNIYYLKNLCDAHRFPNWPIKNPVDLLKDILEAWKEEVEKKPNSMSADDAYDVLELTHEQREAGLDENVIRRAYFRLAQKYHPDKNPEGRDKFEEINKAYEFLVSKNLRNRCVEGPDPVNITLILRAQSILFNQCSDELHPYKYSGYPMLVKTLRMETEDEQLFSKPHPLLPHACETAFHTVKCSALNAEELRREGGLEILKEAFSRCVSVLSQSSVPNDVAVQVSIHIVRCFTVAASFPACRTRIVELSSISKDIGRILYYNRLTRLCLCAVECISAFAADEVLQQQLFDSGVLFSLLLFLFKYDYTLEEGGVEADEETNQQQVANQLAKMSIIACARLAGDLTDEEIAAGSRSNPTIGNCLQALLTPYLSRQLGISNVAQLLKTLNSNIENPYLIWDNATRAELIDYLETQQREIIRSGRCPDETWGASFTFSSHKDELIVGEIFVRVFNEMPSFPLTNAKEFTVSLLDHVGSQAQYLHSALATQTQLNPERIKNVEMCLQALFNVIKNNAGVETKCIGHFKLLFSLLRADQWPQIQLIVVNVIACVSGNQECVNDIASSEVLVYLLLVLHAAPSADAVTRQTTVLETMLPLMTNSKLVRESMVKGGVLYLLDIFCNSSDHKIREKSAELLAKMTIDKLNGPKIRLILCKFLPVSFIESMKESPQEAVNLFDRNQENPELIWADEARTKVSSTIRTMSQSLYSSQLENPATNWKLDDDFEIKIPIAADEMVVAGVFLRLFVLNPSWTPQRLKQFLTELMDTVQSLMSKSQIDETKLELSTKALVSLLQARPPLLDMIPPMGYIKGLIDQLSNSKHSLVPHSALSVLHQLSYNKPCVESMIQYDYILSQMIKAISSDTTLAALGCQTLNNMFVADANDKLVPIALQVKLIDFLLKLLDSGQSTYDSSTKAIIVQLLKSMLQSQAYGEQVGNILDKNPVWSEFRDQKHDLFITNSHISGYLTGNTNVAGYLTQGGSLHMASSNFN